MNGNIKLLRKYSDIRNLISSESAGACPDAEKTAAKKNMENRGGSYETRRKKKCSVPDVTHS